MKKCKEQLQKIMEMEEPVITEEEVKPKALNSKEEQNKAGFLP